ncbi:MAG: GNAT family N-acetyltransferase [Acidimicrobiales bacterium]
MTLAAATDVSEELRQLWDAALSALAATRGGPELLAEALPTSPDPLAAIVAEGGLFLERRDDVVIGFAVVRECTIVGVYVTPAARGGGVARAMATDLFAMAEPPRDALALPGDRAMKSLYESLGLKARLLTMRAE